MEISEIERNLLIGLVEHFRASILQHSRRPDVTMDGLRRYEADLALTDALLTKIKETA